MSRLSSLLVVLLLPVTLMARAPAEEPKREKGASEAERARHLERARAVAGSIRVLVDPKRGESAVKLKGEPVLRYADSTRQAYESSLWIWSEGGRPAAILAVEYYPTGPTGPRWLYEIASLSEGLIAAEREGTFKFTAKEPGLLLKTLPDAPPPAEKEIRRLAQMKELRGRFTAYENATVNGRIELRPLVTPLLRYSDAKLDVLDGAIFALASGTNPEVLLVLEAHQLKGKSEWRYALVHMTGEAATVELDGKEVWQRKGDNPPAVRPSYINGYVEMAKEEK
jgi:hypothetical protein